MSLPKEAKVEEKREVEKMMCTGDKETAGIMTEKKIQEKRGRDLRKNIKYSLKNTECERMLSYISV